MSEESRVDRLAEALEAVTAAPVPPRPSADPELAEMLRIAQELYGLPRPAFKAGLAADLERRDAMATTTPAPGHEDVQSLSVYLAVRPAVGLMDFVKRAFGAQELLRTTGTGGGLHAEVRIGDTKVMIGGGEALGGTPTPAELPLHVPNPHPVYARALGAGAVALYAPGGQALGERGGAAAARAGIPWYIGPHQSGGHVPAGLGTVTPYLHPRGAERLLDFLRQAFSAEEMEVVRAPDE